MPSCRNFAADTRGFVLLVHSAYGEMPEGLAALIRDGRPSRPRFAEMCGAVWVIGRSPGTQSLQSIIEEHINRLGGYVFPRTGGQSAQDYLKRFHKLISSMA